ncbi:MAG: hypothetical protein LKI67_01995 [Olsenella sp.]|nr:hypothetical protein [Olsenella sp.]MCI1810610.1 hypothetical protein [Olsenella sp.]MCI1879307.1 hypothetical protein [Olsenella sp.]
MSDLKGRTCTLISAPEQGSERDYYSDVLGFIYEFSFSRSRGEGRMLVTGNRGFMPIETREVTDPTGGIVRRVPLLGADGTQLSRDYYTYWSKARTNPSIVAFSETLKGMFA